ncbi:MAG: hypothetical protein NDI84_04775 [Steroidobacteraceae bacterium]|nr:hypothetical protein [Steroidobacteraceae bacterium]
MSAILALRVLLVAAVVTASGLPGGVRAADPMAAKFTWTVKALPVVTRSPGEPVPVSIVVGPVPATGVVVMQSALVERISRRPLAPGGMRLCPTASQDCVGQPLSLPANGAAALWLWGADGVGVFEGTVTLAAREKPEGDAVTMTVNSSSGQHKGWGVAAILASIGLTWLLTVFVRNRANRAQLLLPAAIALRTLSAIRMQVEARVPELPAPKVLHRLEDIEQQLSLPVLQANGLPASVPWSGPPAGSTVDAYRKHVQAQNDWLLALSILVREGLQPAGDLWEHTDDGARGQIRAAVMAMDGLSQAVVAPTADALRLALKGIFAAMTAGAKNGPPRAPAAQVGTPEQLLVQIAGLGAAGWVFLLLVTTLGGAYILVLGPAGAGFGTITDYAQCCLWGAGMPAGAQLMQSTTASIATSFGVAR